MMNRRSFIKNSAAVAPLIVAFNPLAAAQTQLLQNLGSINGKRNKILVLIQLTGGNDGLNTVIPLDKYSILSEARKNILIPDSKVLKLNDSSTYGFHPSMQALQRLYHDKLVSVIPGVGYPNTDLSHFHGINIKYTAHIEEKEIRSGWVGRYLDELYPGYPKGYPAQSNDGPPAMRIGTVSPKIAQGINDQDMSIGITNITDFDNFYSGIDKDPVSDDLGGMNVATIRAISRQIEIYGPIIKSYVTRQSTLSKLYPVPEKNTLADQLKIVARLIGSGLNTPFYVVRQLGYDTHGEQVDPSNTTTGRHADLLADLSEAIAAFQDDLFLMGKQDEVMGMTFSEFGRRIASSDSYGTDHGTAETVIMFGTNVRNGILGPGPELPSIVTVNDNLLIEHDFRTLYASVLTGWFGASEDIIKRVISETPGERLNLFRS